MPRNVYITAMEPRSGRSVVALGLMGAPLIFHVHGVRLGGAPAHPPGKDPPEIASGRGQAHRRPGVMQAGTRAVARPWD